MPLISSIIVLVTILGLAIWTGFLISVGLTTGAIGTGTLAIIVVFFTWVAFLGVPDSQDR